MCLAIPLQIKKIDGNDAIAERSGVSRRIRLDFITEPQVGDYVIVHAGFAIERLPKEQADEDQAAANEVDQILAEMEKDVQDRIARRKAGQLG